MSVQTLKALMVTAELLNTDLSEAAMRVMEMDLSEYEEGTVLQALTQCRRELTGRLTLAAILERIQGADGRPGPDEAWAIAAQAADEAETVVWTDEMARAYHQAAYPLLANGDKIGARMAFREAYAKMVKEAQSSRIKPRWAPTLGTDPQRRQEAIRRSVELRRMTADSAQKLLPSEDLTKSPVAGLLTSSQPLEDATERLAKLRKQLSALQDTQK